MIPMIMLPQPIMFTPPYLVMAPMMAYYNFWSNVMYSMYTPLSASRSEPDNV